MHLLRGGGTGSETGGDPQQGEVIKEFPREGGIITEGGTYNLHEDYTGCLYLQLKPGDSAVVNVTGNVHSEVGEQEAVLALQSGNVTINNNNHVFTVTGPANGGGRCYYNSLYSNAKPETTINGGIYRCSSSNLETLFNYTGILWLNDVTSEAAIADAVDNWATTYINGGKYDSDELTILNQPNAYIKFNGNVRVHADHGVALRNKGTAVIWKGTYMNTSEEEPTIGLLKGSKTFVYGGTFKNTNTEQLGKVFSNAGELTIDGADVQIENVGGTACAVGNTGTLTFNNGTVTAPNGAAILNTSSTTNTGATISGGTIKDSKYGIQVSSGQVKLNDVTFSNNENDIYLMQGMKITIADSFTKRATIKVEDADAFDGRRLTEGENKPGLNLVSNNSGFKVAYNETGKYYYLTPRTGYMVDAVDATATIKVGGVDTKVDPNDEIDKGTPVTLTADPAPVGQKFAGWTVKVNGVVRSDLLPNGEEDQTPVTFEMPEGNVMVKAEYEPVDPVGPADPSGEVDPVLTGAIVTGAVLVGAYEAGTGIYRLAHMRGIPLPSNRIELAELVWERAGKPEPQNMTDENLYADIDADDTDAQKAAHWMVEQELMKFDEDNNKFHPCFPVSKLRVCLTWQNAKDKGLID